MKTTILPDALRYLLHDYDLAAWESVWHVRAFFVGFQSAVLEAGIDTSYDGIVWDAFVTAMKKAFSSENEHNAIWLSAESPRHSAKLFLNEFERFLKNRGPFPARDYVDVNRILNLSGILRTMRSSSGFYLPAQDITYLKAWLEGIDAANNVLKFQEIRPDINGFERWLKSQGESTYRCTWDMLLTSFSGGDRRAAFTAFFNELEKYQKVNPVASL